MKEVSFGFGGGLDIAIYLFALGAFEGEDLIAMIADMRIGIMLIEIGVDIRGGGFVATFVIGHKTSVGSFIPVMGFGISLGT